MTRNYLKTFKRTVAIHYIYTYSKRMKKNVGRQRLAPVILATQEAEIR
jgi:hypothetical protein